MQFIVNLNSFYIWKERHGLTIVFHELSVKKRFLISKKRHLFSTYYVEFDMYLLLRELGAKHKIHEELGVACFVKHASPNWWVTSSDLSFCASKSTIRCESRLDHEAVARVDQYFVFFFYKINLPGIISKWWLDKVSKLLYEWKKAAISLN